MLYIFERVIGFALLVFLAMEVSIPSFFDEPLFPRLRKLFRKKPLPAPVKPVEKAREELEAAKERKTAAEIRVDVARLEKEAERIEDFANNERTS